MENTIYGFWATQRRILFTCITKILSSNYTINMTHCKHNHGNIFVYKWILIIQILLYNVIDYDIIY